MEIDSELNLPLLENIENDIGNVEYMATKLRGISYRNKNKLFLKIVQGDEWVIPKEYTYKKKKKLFVHGDYIQILLLENIKQLIIKNENMETEMRRMKDRIYELEKRSVNAKEEIARELELIRILLESLLRRSK